MCDPNSTQSIADYLAQLLKDRKQIAAFPNVFIHVERLLEEGKAAWGAPKGWEFGPFGPLNYLGGWALLGAQTRLSEKGIRLVVRRRCYRGFSEGKNA